MAGFEQQGLSAASCEPFFEWCKENGVDLRLSAVVSATQQQRYEMWNQILAATKQGELERAGELLAGYQDES